SPISWDDSGGGVTIHGNGMTIDAAGQPSALVDNGGQGVAIDGFTIKGGGGTASSDAAPLVSQGGAMTVSSCTFTSNAVHSAGTGGFGGDVAGGVLSEGGDVDIHDCTLSHNTATTTRGDGAGGVLSEGGDVTIARVTVQHNSSSSGNGD